MVCRHCVDTVRRVLEQLPHVGVSAVELGYAIVCDELSDDDLKTVAMALETEGFELIRSRESELVEAVKHMLIELSRKDFDGKINLSDYIGSAITVSYSTLSRIFSEMEGRTIENYFVSLRIERVKELIKYRQLTLSEIAYLTGYSSVAHLSRQFKQMTGMTPTEFRNLGSRRPLTDV